MMKGTKRWMENAEWDKTSNGKKCRMGQNVEQ